VLLAPLPHAAAFMTAVALRALGFLVLIAITAAVAIYVFTKDRRWLRWAWRLFAGAVAVALIVAAFLILERLVVAI
jgi:hypothetical protein